MEKLHGADDIVEMGKVSIEGHWRRLSISSGALMDRGCHSPQSPGLDLIFSQKPPRSLSEQTFAQVVVAMAFCIRDAETSKEDQKSFEYILEEWFQVAGYWILD